MNIQQAIHAFFASPSGTAAYGVLVVMALDLALGVLAALRDGTFALDEVAAFLRKHVAGRVLPIWAILFFGYIGNLEVLTVAGLAMAAAYVAETIGSIISSWGPPGLKTRLNLVQPIQPVPTD